MEERIASRYRDRIGLELYDIDIPGNIEYLFGIEEARGIKDQSSTKLFFPFSYLSGKDIMTRFDTEVAPYVKSDSIVRPIGDAQKIVIPERDYYFSRVSALAVLGAGLVDGINPCAFGVIVFLFSLLFCLKKGRGEIIQIGFVFSVAVFLSYFLLGLGAMKIMKALAVFEGIYAGILFIFIIVLFVLGIISLMDAFNYRRSGDPNAVLLKLPERIKRATITIMNRGLRKDFLLPSVFGVGVLVTLFESVCTGQLYLPTILLILKNDMLNMRAWAYLFLYNLMFILPLVVVTIATYCGLSSQALIAISKRNVFIAKILLAITFVVLALLLLLFMG